MFELWLIHTRKHKETDLQYPNKDDRGNKEQEERARWHCWRALTDSKRETVWVQNVPYASLLWLIPKPLTALLPDQFNCPLSPYPVPLRPGPLVSGSLTLTMHWFRVERQCRPVMTRACEGKKTWEQGWLKRKKQMGIQYLCSALRNGCIQKQTKQKQKHFLY